MSNMSFLRENKMKTVRFATIAFTFLAVFFVAHGASADWQSTLQTTFPTAKVVETFDNLQDWSTGGWNNSGTGGSAFDATYAPKKDDGSDSQWGYWNVKQSTMLVDNISGTWSIGDSVIGATSGKSYAVSAIWDLDDGTWFQLGDVPNYSVAGYVAGENLSNGSGATAVFVAWPTPISNHGSAYTWQGTGKSLQMNVGINTNPAGMTGIGAQRLGAYYGDGIPQSGLKKAHIFMMTKFRETNSIMTKNGTIFPYLTFKLFDSCAGFVDIGNWGTVEERASLNQSSTRLPQMLYEYGPNMSIFDIKGGSSFPDTLMYYESPFVPKLVTGGYDYNDLPTQFDNGSPAGAINIGSFITAGQWYGLELAIDIGTLGGLDGSSEIWVYNQGGEVVAHDVRTGLDHLQVFDHYYNKITLGGNILDNSSVIQPPNTDGRFYYDDVIVNDSRIGPTYFSTLSSFSASADLTPPSAPSGLLVN